MVWIKLIETLFLKFYYKRETILIYYINIYLHLYHIILGIVAIKKSLFLEF